MKPTPKLKRVRKQVADGERKSVLAEAQKLEVADRWKMIEMLDLPKVKKTMIPLRYRYAWDQFFEGNRLKPLSQTEFSGLYRYLVKKGILNDNF